MTVAPFLLLTFAISLAGFAFVYVLPTAQSPNTLAGLPFWLLMIWGPSLAALILANSKGDAVALLARVVQLQTIPPAVWLLVIAPLLLLGVLMPFAPGTRTGLTLSAAVAMVVFNLFLGPLGEELGWRGVMQPLLTARFGWLAASLMVGVVWLVWHLPLWTIASPHAAIPLVCFAVHCMAYSVMIGAASTLSGGSLLPAVLLHLAVNLAANFATLAGFPAPGDWFRVSLWPYLGLAFLSVVLVEAQ